MFPNFLFSVCSGLLFFTCGQATLRKISKIMGCHQMSDFEAKMQQIRFWGSSPGALEFTKEKISIRLIFSK